MARRRKPARKRPGPASKSAPDLPLDDPRWMPVDAAHKRMCEPTGEPQLAARDLTEALARERDGLRSMRRSIHGADPERELLPPLYWVVHDVRWMRREVGEPILAVCRRDRRHAVGPDGFIGPSFSYVYYGWLPDLERLWPTVFPPPTLPPEKKKRKKAPGRPIECEY